MFAGSYCGSPPDLYETASRWNFDPVLLLVLGILSVAVMRWGNRMAAGGIGLLVVAFVSPLCAAGGALFSVRSVHHLLLMAAALLFALAVRAERGSGRPVRSGLPAGATVTVMTIVLWAWHIPTLYDAALANMAIYWTMQITIFASSFAFWLAILRAGAVSAVGGLTGGTLQMGLLGAVLTFATRPLYGVHALAAPSWGLSGLADQQLAGLIMWVGGMLPFAIGGAVIAGQAWQRQNSDDAASQLIRNPA